MANVNINFNGKDYLLSCDNGQEEHLIELAEYSIAGSISSNLVTSELQATKIIKNIELYFIIYIFQ